MFEGIMIVLSFCEEGKERILTLKNDIAVANLMIANRDRISSFHSGKPALTNKFLSRLAVECFWINSKDHLIELAADFETLKQSLPPDGPSINRVRLDNAYYGQLQITAAHILQIYDIHISTPNAFRLAHLELKRTPRKTIEHRIHIANLLEDNALPPENIIRML